MQISTRKQPGPADAAHMRGAWRWYVALLTALSFFLVTAASASHLHQTAAANHDCAICCVVLDKLADAPPPPVLVLVHAATLQSYRLVAVTECEVSYSLLQLLPPSCGPPHASA